LRVLHKDQGESQEETPQDKDRLIEQGSLRLGPEELEKGGYLGIVKMPSPHSLDIKSYNHGDRKKEHGRCEVGAPFARTLKALVVQQVYHREQNKLQRVLEKHQYHEIHKEQGLKNMKHFEGPKVYKIHPYFLNA
jgi:hypothetical protein